MDGSSRMVLEQNETVRRPLPWGYDVREEVPTRAQCPGQAQPPGNPVCARVDLYLEHPTSPPATAHLCSVPPQPLVPCSFHGLAELHGVPSPHSQISSLSLQLALPPHLPSHGGCPSLRVLSSSTGTSPGSAHELARAGISCQASSECHWHAAWISGCLPRAWLCLAAPSWASSRGWLNLG